MINVCEINVYDINEFNLTSPKLEGIITIRFENNKVMKFTFVASHIFNYETFDIIFYNQLKAIDEENNCVSEEICIFEYISIDDYNKIKEYIRFHCVRSKIEQPLELPKEKKVKVYNPKIILSFYVLIILVFILMNLYYFYWK